MLISVTINDHSEVNMAAEHVEAVPGADVSITCQAIDASIVTEVGYFHMCTLESRV